MAAKSGGIFLISNKFLEMFSKGQKGEFSLAKKCPHKIKQIIIVFPNKKNC